MLPITFDTCSIEVFESNIGTIVENNVFAPHCKYLYIFTIPVPYFCSQGSLIEALNVCMSGIMGDPDMDEIFRQTDSWSSSGDIDSTSNMRSQRVFVFHGTEDPTVMPGKVCCKIDRCQRLVVKIRNVRIISSRCY